MLPLDRPLGFPHLLQSAASRSAVDELATALARNVASDGVAMASSSEKRGGGCGADITFVSDKTGFLYLLAIMDWATRGLIWRLSNSMQADFCVDALNG